MFYDMIENWFQTSLSPVFNNLDFAIATANERNRTVPNHGLRYFVIHESELPLFNLRGVKWPPE